MWYQVARKFVWHSSIRVRVPVPRTRILGSRRQIDNTVITVPGRVLPDITVNTSTGGTSSELELDSNSRMPLQTCTRIPYHLHTVYVHTSS